MNKTAKELMTFYRNPLVIASIRRLQDDGITCMDTLLELAQQASVEIDALEVRNKELKHEVTKAMQLVKAMR